MAKRNVPPLVLALIWLRVAMPSFAVAADDCSNLTPGNYSCEITFDSVLRSFRVHVPASIAPQTPAPLVLDIHGWLDTAERQRLISGWSAKSDLEGFIVVWPQAVDDAWDAQGDCCLFGEGSRDDVGFLEEVVAEVSAAANVDADRVYATGLSNGGSMTHTMACSSADIFAGAAPVAYGLSGGEEVGAIIANCNPSQGIPVIHFHGSADLTVFYSVGRFDSIGALASLDAWSEIQSCDLTATEYSVGTNTSCKSYANCDEGAEVVLCTVNFGGHILYPDITGTTIPDVAWAFFEAHSVPEPGVNLSLILGGLFLAIARRGRGGRGVEPSAKGMAAVSGSTTTGSTSWPSATS